jgi:molybdopterin molybdotransferase
MDGYAVRAEDLAAASESAPVKLRLVGGVPAGSAEDPEMTSGEAVQIMTGAPLPTDADTVVPQELTDKGDEVVAVYKALPRGRHVRIVGEDRESGERIAEPGTGLTPEALAAIASAGVAEVTVSRRPRLAVISTGDELVPPGQNLSRGQIPDSNRMLISMLAEEAGATATSVRVGDRPEQLAGELGRIRGEAEVIVLTGGVSVGAFDPVKAVFGGDDFVKFDRVAMQPGKPQAFGRLDGDGPLLFGLPGNPVSAWVSFQMFVRPALRRMQGFLALMPEAVPGRASERWRTPKGRQQVIPVRIHDSEERSVQPAAAGGSGSHLVASLAAADGYALVDAEVEEILPGDTVQTVRLRDPEQFNQRPRSRP